MVPRHAVLSSEAMAKSRRSGTKIGRRSGTSMISRRVGYIHKIGGAKSGTSMVRSDLEIVGNGDGQGGAWTSTKSGTDTKSEIERNRGHTRFLSLGREIGDTRDPYRSIRIAEIGGTHDSYGGT